MSNRINELGSEWIIKLVQVQDPAVQMRLELKQCLCYIVYPLESADKFNLK